MQGLKILLLWPKGYVFIGKYFSDKIWRGTCKQLHPHPTVEQRNIYIKEAFKRYPNKKKKTR